MPTFSRLFATLLLVLVGSALQRAQAGTISVNAGRGPVTVHVPSSYDPQQPMPLLMLLHGYGSNGPVTESYLNLLPVSEQRGFIYVFPTGSIDGGGSTFWNATNACCNFYGSNIDDSGYLRALIDQIKLALTVDTRRVYVAGHSNGGFMAHRMACEHADTIAAVVSLAGATFNNPAACTPSESVHVLQIHGSSDGTISFNGGSLLGQIYPSAQGTAERWATKNGCALTQDTSSPNLDLVSNIAGAETTVTRWVTSCNEGGSAELWKIVGAGHVPNFNASFGNLVIDYLYAHPQPGLGASYCASNANSSGAAAMIRASGTTSLTNNNLVLEATSVPINSSGIFFYGPLVQAVPLGNGVLCIGTAGLTRLPVTNSGAQGFLQYPVDLSSPPSPAGQIQAGSTWKFQAWFRDISGGGAQSNLSDAVSLTFEL